MNGLINQKILHLNVAVSSENLQGFIVAARRQAI
jgi:hypothetical protein